MAPGFGMRLGMSVPTPMRYTADKPDNPSSFQGHCCWPSKHTHSQPHSRGIGRQRFYWGTAEHGFLRRFCLLRCEYFFDIRMNGSGCNRCLALTMQDARAPSKKGTIELFVLPPPLTHLHSPKAQRRSRCCALRRDMAMEVC